MQGGGGSFVWLSLFGTLPIAEKQQHLTYIKEKKQSKLKGEKKETGAWCDHLPSKKARQPS